MSPPGRGSVRVTLPVTRSQTRMTWLTLTASDRASGEKASAVRPSWAPEGSVFPASRRISRPVAVSQTTAEPSDQLPVATSLPSREKVDESISFWSN